MIQRFLNGRVGEQLLKIATDALLTTLPVDNVVAMPLREEMPLAA